LRGLESWCTLTLDLSWERILNPTPLLSSCAERWWTGCAGWLTRINFIPNVLISTNIFVNTRNLSSIYCSWWLIVGYRTSLPMPSRRWRRSFAWMKTTRQQKDTFWRFLMKVWQRFSRRLLTSHINGLLISGNECYILNIINYLSMVASPTLFCLSYQLISHLLFHTQNEIPSFFVDLLDLIYLLFIPFIGIHDLTCRIILKINPTVFSS